MKREINIAVWERADQFRFFSSFTEPFFGVTVRIDCTQAYRYAKENNLSFFLVYLYQALKAANRTEAFRYRITDGRVFLFDQVHASPTINRPNGTFGFAYMDFHEGEAEFYAAAQQEIDAVQQSTGLIPAVAGENVIHFSAVPWLDFTSLSHARNYHFPDSCPKISFGKVTEENGVKTMPVSVHVHHALADGFHVGQFVETFQEGMKGL
ncbi:chloramphenicol acetyltransferase [Chitinophaga lutea]|uniref:Chloramphenicol acetyltransferase n=1 Tax=Chitinophaga lutea TaxID=2488634 RepID=A0A3N4PX63_9BACT|nr:chloramphenicol acetyltransferase [Chitinophaga lutea]RPE12496.1 chloramphenicol acetyltransferase [Chitinophaga lutea]